MIKNFGGDEENRTPDPLLARQVLSQLSYTPTDAWLPLIERGVSMQSGMARRLSVLYSVFRVYRFALVGLGGLEPPTSRLSGVRSNHLSYKPMLVSGDGRRFFVFRRPVVEMRRIELLTPCLQGRCSPS